VIRAVQYASALGVLIALGRLNGGCSSTDEPAVSSSNDPILGGTVVTAAQFPQLVTVSGSAAAAPVRCCRTAGCSLPAHCIPGAHVTPGPANPTMNVTEAALGTSAVAAAFYMPGTYNLDIVKATTTTPQTDVAVLRLTTPFVLDLTNRQSLLHLYPYANAGLANST
jgi:hypothetical protein